MTLTDYSHPAKNGGIASHNILVNGNPFSPAGGSNHTISFTGEPVNAVSKLVYTLKDGDDVELGTGDIPLQSRCSLNQATFRNGDKDDVDHVATGFGGKIWTNGITV